jgi:DNA-binding transcriptional regulator YiaG
MKIIEDFETQLWSKVEKTKDCWLWKGAKIKGYGSIRHKGKHYYVHRLVWELKNGIIPNGLMVCHHCDTPACVRLNHLFLGTQAENIKDMYAKSRNAAITKPNSFHRGEQHCRAKLTQVKADEIRSLYKQGKISQRQLAKQFGVSQKIINLIVNNKHWVN